MIYRTENRILNAGQPSEQELHAHATDGVKTVISLRAPTEATGFDEPALCQELGMAFVNIPIAGPEDLTRDSAAQFSRELDTAVALGDVLVHCGTSNRVGAMMALHHAWQNNASPYTAIQLGKQYGLTGLEQAVRDLLE